MVKSLICDFEATTPPHDFIYDSSNPDIVRQLKEMKTKVWAGCFSDLDKDDHFVHSQSIEEFMRKLFMNKDVNCYFHNLGGYDGPFILNYLFERGYKFLQQTDYPRDDQKLCTKYVCGTVDGFTVYKDGNRYNFIDTTSLLTGSISQFGESLSAHTGEDFSKGDTPLLSYDEYPSADDERWPEWWNYIDRDVHILKETMKIMRIAEFFESDIRTTATLAYKTLLRGGEEPEVCRVEEFKPNYSPKKIHMGSQFKKCVGFDEEGEPIIEDMTPREKAKKQRENKRKRELNKLSNKNSNASKRKRGPNRVAKVSNGYKGFKELLKKIEVEPDPDIKQKLINQTKGHANKDLTKIINAMSKESYKGGICYVNPLYQDKWVGCGTVLDVNSMYPWIYSTMKLPGNFKRFVHEKDITKLDTSKLFTIKFKFLNADCRPDKMPLIKPRTDDKYNVKLTSSHIPVKRTDYYLHELELEHFSMTSMELQYLLDNYDITSYEVTTIVEYHRDYKLESLCKAHVDKWIKVKQHAKATGNKFMEWYAKLMLNAAYGKFGNFDKYYDKRALTVVNGRLMDAKIGSYRGGNDLAEVSTASFITAYGRVHLANTINQIGMDRFLYCDTDSVHILGLTIPDFLHVDEFELGAWDDEKQFTKAKFIKAKTYGELFMGKTTFKTTCAGLTYQVDMDHFDSGVKVPSKRKYYANGGTILIDTLIEIGTVDENYLSYTLDYINNKSA